MPAFEVIVRIVEDDQALDDCATEVKDGREISLPCADNLPAYAISICIRCGNGLTDR